MYTRSRNRYYNDGGVSLVARDPASERRWRRRDAHDGHHRRVGIDTAAAVKRDATPLPSRPTRARQRHHHGGATTNVRAASSGRTRVRRPRGLRVLCNRRLGVCREPPDRRQAPHRDAASPRRCRARNKLCRRCPRKLPYIHCIVIMRGVTAAVHATSRSFRRPRERHRLAMAVLLFAAGRRLVNATTIRIDVDGGGVPVPFPCRLCECPYVCTC